MINGTVEEVVGCNIGVRANIHLGGQTEFFCPNGERKLFAADHIRWGGVVAEISSDLQGVVADIFSVNCNNRPYIRVNQTCIVFCPNNLDSLPELMSTNSPNWGGQLPPLTPHPVRLLGATTQPWRAPDNHSDKLFPTRTQLSLSE